ncbi:hypothetical protein Tco_1162965 [Tanacetum coccineum]
MVSTESKKIEKYIRGFPERIKGNITSSKPATLHEAINRPMNGEQSVKHKIGDQNSVRAFDCAQHGGKIYALKDFTKMQPVQLPSSWTRVLKCAKDVKVRSHRERIVELGFRVQAMMAENGYSFTCKYKADEKKLDDIRVVRDFPEAHRQLLDLHYRLCPFNKMLELSNQLKELQEKGFIRPSHSPWGSARTLVKKNRCVLFLQDQSSFGISPVKSLRGRYTEDHTPRLVVLCDASNMVLGGADAAGKVIAYASRQLKKHDKNYTTHDLELDKILEARSEEFQGLKDSAKRLEGLDKDTVSNEMMITLIWNELRESPVIGQIIVQERLKDIFKIKKDWKTVGVCQKAMSDKRRKLLIPISLKKRDVKKLKRRRIPLVKVRWNSRQGAEYTWEHEDQFRKKYRHLFSEIVPPSGVAT